MPIHNDDLTIADLVRPLSYEALEYFASGEIMPSREFEDVLTGKFIRIGEVMLIGSSIKFGEPIKYGSKLSVSHQHLINQLRNYPELIEVANATPQDELNLWGILTDAGYSRIIMNNDRPSELVLRGDSWDYGRANPDGRQLTAEIAQRLVGTSVEVILGD